MLISIYNKYLYDSRMSMGLNYGYGMGSILGLLLVVQVVSGVMLSMHYVATEELAFESVEGIMREVPLGYVIRMTHGNGATILFMCMYIHIGRSIKYTSYTRKEVWNIGVIILVMMIITAFIGYSLVYGQMSYWAIAVITNILTVIPYFGKEIIRVIYGGYNIGGATLGRFYTIHYILPIIMIGMSMLHIIALHRKGNNQPMNIVSKIGYVGFHPYYTLKDLIGYSVIGVGMVYIIMYDPNRFMHSDNYVNANSLVTPSHIQPEIYLLPFYSILRSIPERTIGVIALIGAILVLVWLPYKHRGLISSSIFRPIMNVCNNILFGTFIMLGYLGQAPLEEPYMGMGKIGVIVYYSYYIIMVPLLSRIEALMVYKRYGR